MNNTPSIINTQGLDISKPADFANFVKLAKEVQTQLDAAWGFVEQQMLDRNVGDVQGNWGKVTLTHPKTLKMTSDVEAEFIQMKPTLDTKKVHNYEGLFGELPIGVEYVIGKRFDKSKIKIEG
jgi:hypothetical protein